MVFAVHSPLKIIEELRQVSIPKLEHPFFSTVSGNFLRVKNKIEERKGNKKELNISRDRFNKFSIFSASGIKQAILQGGVGELVGKVGQFSA